MDSWAKRRGRQRATRHNDPSKRPNLRESSRTAEGGRSEGQQGFNFLSARGLLLRDLVERRDLVECPL